MLIHYTEETREQTQEKEIQKQIRGGGQLEVEEGKNMMITGLQSNWSEGMLGIEEESSDDELQALTQGRSGMGSQKRLKLEDASASSVEPSQAQPSQAQPSQAPPSQAPKRLSKKEKEKLAKAEKEAAKQKAKEEKAQQLQLAEEKAKEEKAAAEKQLKAELHGELIKLVAVEIMPAKALAINKIIMLEKLKAHASPMQVPALCLWPMACGPWAAQGPWPMGLVGLALAASITFTNV